MEHEEWRNEYCHVYRRNDDAIRIEVPLYA